MNAQVKILNNWFKNNTFYSKSLLSNEEKIKRQGEMSALKLFYDASSNVPAYKDFLKKSKINPLLIKSMKDFKNISFTSKENYIDKYDFKSRCWKGNSTETHMISTSSGTTGKPHFWPRDLRSEIDGAFPHELILKNLFSVHRKKTLFINGFAMGNWIAGTFTLACVNLVAWKGYPLTIMTPGYSTEAVIETVENLINEYEQIIVSGHTPFLKELVELLSKKKLLGNKHKILLLGTGQAITENWREYILKLLDSKDYYKTFINLYGSADAALMGFETPVTILIRKYLSEQMELSKNFFKDERLPSLYNFDPRLTFFESINGELAITKYGGCPLIRYNIHDNGGVINFGEFLSQIGANKFKTHLKTATAVPLWKFPFVYLFGREKFMVKIYGANVYSEHVLFALNHKTLQPYLTGRFVLEEGYDKDYEPRIFCHIELNIDTKETDDLRESVRNIFIDEVRQVNSEYNYVLNNVGEKVKPEIILYEYGHPKYFPKDKIKKTA